MKNFKILSIFMFILLGIYACGGGGGGGSDDDDSGTTTSGGGGGNEEEGGTTGGTEEEEPTPPTIRYNSAVMNFQSIDDVPVNHTVRMNFNRRPITISGTYIEVDVECDFSFRLTNAEALELEERAEALRVCHVDDPNPEEEVDFGEFNTIALRQGSRTINADKEFHGLEEQDYLCEGVSGFYNYVKSHLRDNKPADCPMDVDAAIDSF